LSYNNKWSIILWRRLWKQSGILCHDKRADFKLLEVMMASKVFSGASISLISSKPDSWKNRSGHTMEVVDPRIEMVLGGW
jgi:hypothetical protein